MRVTQAEMMLMTRRWPGFTQAARVSGRSTGLCARELTESSGMSGVRLHCTCDHTDVHCRPSRTSSRSWTRLRKEAAAALMQASLAQRALSKAEEAWEAERSALREQLAQAAQPSPDKEAWEAQRSAANKELQLASKHMAELQQLIDSTQRCPGVSSLLTCASCM